jgi:VWFA-related protein
MNGCKPTLRWLTAALSALLPLLCSSPLRAVQDAPPFRANVNAVVVDVLVANGARPVPGLTAGDFELFDNGVPQRIDLVSFDQVPLNVVLAFDVSESVSGERMAQLQRASAALLGALAPDDQAALVTFHEKVRLASLLTKDRRAIAEALDLGSGSGSTALADAVYAAITVGESEPGRALVIVFSDGVDTASWLTSARLADTAKRSDVVIYAATTRSRTKPALLSEMTQLTGGQLHEVDRNQDLRETFLRILAEFRTRYLLSYSATGVTSTGWHTLQVRVKGRRATVRARPGYLAGP